ncbi:hypothetical protein L1049_024884 [Liquidambar formosana]|uniref:Uncharacterized protein n=1 Tax=Liquidambar formosana TaxID=63359 RepID=A0AAP0X5G0_LIQFO
MTMNSSPLSDEDSTGCSVDSSKFNRLSGGKAVFPRKESRKKSKSDGQKRELSFYDLLEQFVRQAQEDRMLSSVSRRLTLLCSSLSLYMIMYFILLCIMQTLN